MVQLLQFGARRKSCVSPGCYQLRVLGFAAVQWQGFAADAASGKVGSVMRFAFVALLL